MKPLRILTGLIFIILLVYYWNDLLMPKMAFEFLVIVGYLVFPLLIIENLFQRPVSKNEEKIRIKRYNWNYLFAWTSLGVLAMLIGIVDNGFE